MKPMPFSMASLILLHSYTHLLLLLSFLPSFLAAAAVVSHDECMPSDLQALRSFASSFSYATAVTHVSSDASYPYVDYEPGDTVVFRESWMGYNCCSWAGVTCTSRMHNHTHSISRVSELSLMQLEFSTDEARVFSSHHDIILRPLCNLSSLSVLYLQLGFDASFDELAQDTNAGFFLPFPECLGDLLSLRILSLSGWYLKGTLPSSFSRLLHLQHLDLSLNRGLSGSLLPLTNLPNLTTLDLISCAFTGPLPPFHTPLLQHLHLSNNFINSTLHDFSFFSSLPSLTSLDLSFNRIFGTLPSSLSKLTALTSLDLYVNQFTGLLPSSLSKLTALTRLWLTSNQFTGPLPSSLSNLTALTRLYLTSNQFTGPLPSSLSNLTALTTLDLSHNQFTGPLPGSLSRLTALTSLGLSDNQFTGPLPSSLSRLTALTWLDLSANQFTGPLPSSLSKLTALTSLRLSYNQFAGALPGSFCKLTALTELDLSSNALGGSVEALAECKAAGLINLTSLHLSQNQFTGPFPRWIGHSNSLNKLELSSNDFRGPLPEEWQSLQMLGDLDLSGNSGAGRIPEWIFQYKSLRSLGLGSMNLRSEDLQCSAKLSMLNHTLWSLDLSSNLLAGPDVPSCLALHNFTWLGDLNLANNRFVGKVPIQMLSSLSSMSTLNLSHNRFDGFDACIQNRSNLQELSIIDISNNALADNLSCVLHALGLPLESCHPGDQVGPQWSEIDLSHNDLVGEIPASLGRCVGNQLYRIKLNNNRLSGQIPHELGDLQHLQTLALNNNNLEGTISPFLLTSMTSLQLLDFSYNNLEGTLQSFLSSLSNLGSLRALLLSYNRIKGSIPSSFGNFSSALQLIDLSNNNLTGAIPQDLHLPSFQAVPRRADSEASLADTTLYEEVPLVIKGQERSYPYLLKVMTSLDLSSNHLIGSIPPQLGDLAGLQFLNLSYNDLTGRIPVALGKLSMLESLDLSHNKLKGSIPRELSSLSKLAVFNVSFNKELTGRIPTGPQLEDEESYIGDPLLCVSQNLSDCKVENGTDHAANATKVGKRRGAVREWMDEWISYAGLSLGIVVGFGVTVWLLLGPTLLRMIPYKS